MKDLTNCNGGIELAFSFIWECHKRKESLDQFQLVREFGSHLDLVALALQRQRGIRIYWFIESLSVNTTLTNLDLSGNDLCDSGAASLCEVLLINTALTNLNLSCNKIGAASLSKALSVNNILTSLNLSYNEIGD